MKLDPDQLQYRFRLLQIDIARLARQHAVKAQRRGEPARGGFSRQRLFPIQPVHADHQPLFALPPDNVGGLHAGVLHMRGNDGKILGIEGDQFEWGRHRITSILRMRNTRSSLIADTLDGCAARGQLLLEPFEPAVEMVDAVDHGLAFGGKACDDQ
ncbi:hypothetical protein GALL_479820 [mine drainage metagenome]|uniref:Uncharacterized protein n=1 Tax=mine drainage metagenome TaxID=410659 RepID=A0A1J5Q3F8_9ZZZZ